MGDEYEEGVTVLHAEAEQGERDLVVVALAGVQRFISESRATSDLSSASEIVARLATKAATVCHSADAEIVFPALDAQADAPTPASGLRSSSGPAGVPNRIVARLPAGTGARVAAEAAQAVEALWTGWVRQTLGREVATPGMPSVQWVCAPASLGDYAAQWRQAQAALVARRRVRDFSALEELQRQLCSLSPRWPAEERLPDGLAEHERDTLSAANWVKRLWRSRLSQTGKRPGFPSTSSIASAPFRQQVLRHLDAPQVRSAVAALRRVVEPLDPVREAPIAGLPASGEPASWFGAAAGRWVYQDTWQLDVLKREYPASANDGSLPDIVHAGHAAARNLLRVMKDAYEVEPPTPYLALLAQDLDGMGRFLGGEEVAGRRIQVGGAEHRAVSSLLGRLAAAQHRALQSEGLLGVPVYAGGDDLLAFAPASTALEAAQRCQGLVRAEPLPTVSTAVLFFHRRSSLRLAVAEARRLLEEAKGASPVKHALAVGFLRRSGVREHSIQPWLVAFPGDDAADDHTAAKSFGIFARPPSPGSEPAPRPLSPRLVTELERDADELARPGLPDDLYRAELARLVERHGGTADDAKALVRLGMSERTRAVEEGEASGRRPAAAARVAVFIRQECR
jgi:CRISPR-associated protein Cmr2